MEPAAVFYDGLNFYHGIEDAGMREWLWVDLWGLAGRLVPEGFHLSEVNYFSAPTKGAPDSRTRQLAFINANKAYSPNLCVYEGFMQAETRECMKCAHTTTQWTEKRSDVSLAVSAVTGGLVERRFSLAVIVTGDADQCTTVESLVGGGVTVISAFPPERQSDHLKKLASKAIPISKRQIKRSQLPDTVGDGLGSAYDRPEIWGERGTSF